MPFAVVLAFVVLASPAAADPCIGGFDPTNRPLSVSSTIPPDGSTITAQSFQGVPFELGTSAGSFSMNVVVSNSAMVGPDGTLGALIDNFFLKQDTSDYQGVSHHGPTDWTNQPGVYYWQAQAGTTDGFHCFTAISPVYTLTVVAPMSSPPPIAIRHVSQRARQIVDQQMGGRPRISTRCTAASELVINCRLRWKAHQSSWFAAALFESYIGPDGSDQLGYDINVVRARRVCSRRQRCKTVRRSSSWQSADRTPVSAPPRLYSAADTATRAATVMGVPAHDGVGVPARHWRLTGVIEQADHPLRIGLRLTRRPPRRRGRVRRDRHPTRDRSLRHLAAGDLIDRVGWRVVAVRVGEPEYLTLVARTSQSEEAPERVPRPVGQPIETRANQCTARACR